MSESVRAKLAAKDPRYAALFASTTVTKPAGKSAAAAVLPECPHRTPLPVRDTQCKGCGGRVMLKVWGCDVHGECTAAKKVAGVAGVCRGCPDNPAVERNPAAPDRKPAAKYTPVEVPDPPPVTTPRTKPLAVVAVAAGEEGRAMYDLSRPWLAAYAARLGADLVELDWPGVPGWGQSAKFQFCKVLEKWDRAVLIDVDTLADPHRCPDMFAMTPPGKVGMYDDRPGVSRAKAGLGLLTEYLQVRSQQGFGVDTVHFYGNTGVVVASREHASIFAPPATPIRPLHCAEQHLWVARLNDRPDLIHLLPAHCNYQWWEWGEFKSPPPPNAILHYSGIRPHRSAAKRLEMMRERVATLAAATAPVPEYVPSPNISGEWAVDNRHREWVRLTLAAGAFRSGLEVGSRHGYSTRAFLWARAAGHLDRLDVCEPNVTPELTDLLAAAGYRGATLYPEKSLDLFAQFADPPAGPCPWDVVFLDGDHATEVVTAEVDWLITRGCRVIFLHDTTAEPQYGEVCVGPQHALARLQAAGYLCLTDSVVRPGELTHRGMSFAAKTPADYTAGLAGYRSIVSPGMIS